MAEILIQRRRHRNVWPWLLGLLAVALLPLPFMAADRDDRPTRPAASRRAAPTRTDTAATLAESAAVPGASTTPGATPAGGGAAGGARETRPTPAASSGQRTTQSAAGAVLSTPPVAPPSGSTPSPAGAAAATVPAPAAAPNGSFDRFIATSNRRASDGEHRQYAAEALRRLAAELRDLGASSAGVRAIVANADSLRMPSTRNSADPDHARAAFLAAVRELDVLRARHRAPVDTGALRAAAWAIRPDQRLIAQRTTVQTFLERARDALHSLSRSRSARRGPDRRSR